MLARISGGLLACAFGWVALLNAQDQPANAAAPVPIATDRPSVTDSSIVVPVDSIQAENGFLDNSTQALRTLDGPETLVRFGLYPKTELRFNVPDYYYSQDTGLNTGAAPGSGLGDLAIGVKQQLGPAPGGFDVSVVAFVSFPAGAQAISSHGYDPGLQVPWSRSLSPKWTLGGMLSLYWPTEGGKRNLTGASPLPSSIANWQDPGVRLSSTRVTFPNAAGHATCCTPEQRLTSQGGNSLTSTSASARRQAQRFTSLGSAIRSGYRLFDTSGSFRQSSAAFPPESQEIRRVPGSKGASRVWLQPCGFIREYVLATSSLTS